MPHECVAIGLPGAGKTTFLAALWHIVESREIKGSLELTNFGHDREYITEIRNKWLELEPSGRTNSTEARVEMSLRYPESGRSEDLIFPDLSGETFRLQLADRVCSAEHHALMNSATGFMLFIHPSNIRHAQRLDENMDVLPAADKNASAVAWSPDFVPTQVQLVELLLLIDEMRDEKPYRLAVNVSAWDTVAADRKPSDWLRNEMPLLHQLLRSQSGFREYKIFGVSAFGGRPDTDVLRLAKLRQPSDRISVIADEGKASHDITIPLKWLMR